MLVLVGIGLCILALWGLWFLSGLFLRAMRYIQRSVAAFANRHPTASSCVGIFVGVTILTFVALADYWR